MNETSIDPTDAMSSPTAELPLFPTTAPAVFSDADATIALFDPVLTALAAIVEVSDDRLDDPTPCRAYTVGELRNHVLGWLTFFAAALNDPGGATDRPVPDTWEPAVGEEPAGVVERASAAIISAVESGVADDIVVMSQARMAGRGVLAMALGEYIVHGWDLATATGRPWLVDSEAADAARTFLEGTVAPEYRGEDSGFFGDEVTAPDDASPLERLLCFAGRDPRR